MIRSLAIILLLFISTNCGRTAGPSTEAIVAHSFVTEWYAWSQELTEDGKILGEMIMDTVNGTPVSHLHFEATLSDFKNKVTMKATEYERMSLPNIAELQACRTIAVDYLRWQATDPVSSMRQVMKLANDANLSQDAKKNKIIQILIKGDEQERLWKDKMDAAVLELREWVDKNG